MVSFMTECDQDCAATGAFRCHLRPCLPSISLCFHHPFSAVSYFQPCFELILARFNQLVLSKISPTVSTVAPTELEGDRVTMWNWLIGEKSTERNTYQGHMDTPNQSKIIKIQGEYCCGGAGFDISWCLGQRMKCPRKLGVMIGRCFLQAR